MSFIQKTNTHNKGGAGDDKVSYRLVMGKILYLSSKVYIQIEALLIRKVSFCSNIKVLLIYIYSQQEKNFANDNVHH